MHPPPFHPDHRLADWHDCFVEGNCPKCGKVTVFSIRMVGVQRGQVRILELVSRLRCSECDVPPAPVYLVAGRSRRFLGGHRPDWAIEIVPEPKD
jgi:hypothetical protein